MSLLRDPERGCPWDVAQTFASIAPYTLEEAYEVADAIEREDFAGLKSELGDLLLQVVFHAQMASEQGRFGFADVVATLSDKLVRRHPHVFGDTTYASLEEQGEAWERIKREERAADGEIPAGALDGVPLALPGLTRAVKLTKKAARVGFDWDEPDIFARTLDFLDSTRMLHCSFTTEIPFPGTQAWKDYRAAGRLMTEDYDEYVGKDHVLVRPAKMTPTQLREGIRWLATSYYSVGRSARRAALAVTNPKQAPIGRARLPALYGLHAYQMWQWR